MLGYVENFKSQKPDDYVIATNHKITIKEFVRLVCNELNIRLKWRGKGINEKAYDLRELYY